MGTWFSVARLAMVLVLLASSWPVDAKEKKSSRSSRSSTSVNAGTVGIISGGIGGTYIRIATDLASVLNDDDRLRILPIVGKGSVQNITDILYLRGIDVGIVQSDVLAYIKRKKIHRNIDKRISYITKLYNEEFHLVGGSDIDTVADLAGRKVNFGVAGSGTFMTASTVFRQLKIKVEPVSFDQALALEKIKTGEIAATVYVAGKPASAISALQTSDSLHLIPVPYDEKLQNTYLPATFNHDDYPKLVAKGKTINSIAVGAVMAVYNWSSDTQRHQKVVRFVESFLSNFSKFLKAPRHKKWREVNLAAQLPGWSRFSYAEQWVKANKKKRLSALRASFNIFLDQSKSQEGQRRQKPESSEELFEQFLNWSAGASSGLKRNTEISNPQ